MKGAGKFPLNLCGGRCYLGVSALPSVLPIVALPTRNYGKVDAD